MTVERKFNEPLFLYSNWREAPLMVLDQQMSVGSIFSSPLVANGVVCFGSRDGFMYVIE